ncbi:hypothetical protein TNCV_2014891 [Trichonephila clavipes]|nr:hypothetical protein TNCV_2014891 [Trichonephila clavipes]
MHRGKSRSPSLRLTRMRSSWFHKLKQDLSEKTTCGDNQFARLCAHESVANTAVDAIDQRVSNCLKEAVRSFMSSGPGVFHHALMSPSSSVHLPVFRVVR